MPALYASPLSDVEPLDDPDLTPDVVVQAVLVAPAPGQRSDARYRATGDELGRGGIGRVVSAWDTQLEREVALKEVQGGDEATVLRFLAEARITGSLEHPSIVPVHELGRRDDGTLYYAMKRVRGQTLAAAMGARPALTDRLELLPHFVDVCRGIAYAHSRGVLHRDLKPANIMVGEFGETVILDWGLAKREGVADVPGIGLSSGRAFETVAGEVVGTPAYMSPEQARGDLEAVDERSDVFSLGVILWELVAGQRAAPGESPGQRAAAGRPPVDQEPGNGVARALRAIATKALSAEPADRYPSASALADEVAAWSQGRRVAAHEYSTWELGRMVVRRNPLAALAAAVALGVLLVGSGLVLRANRIAEGARVAAVEERAQADASERKALATLADAMLDRAERTSASGDRAASVLYAAAAAAEFEAAGVAGDGSARAATLRDRGDASRRLRRAIDLDLPPGSGRPQGVRALEWSPDGRQLAAVLRTGELLVWDRPLDGGEPRVLGGRRASNEPAALSWSPDGRLLAWTRLGPTPTDRTVSVLDVADWSVAADLRWTDGADSLPRDLAFSPDGERLAVGYGRRGVRVFRGLELETELPVSTRILSLAWSDDGVQLAIAALGPSLQVYTRTDGSTRSVPVDFAPSGMTFDAEGRGLLLGSDRGVQVLELSSGLVAQLGTGAVRDPQRLASGLAVVSPGGVRVQDPSGAVIDVLRAPAADVHAWSSEGLVAVGGHGEGAPIRIWRPQATDVTRPLEAPAAVLSFAVGAQSVVAASADRRLTRWDLGGASAEARLGKPLALPSGEGLGPHWVSMSPDGSTVAASSRFGEVHLHPLAAGAPARVLREAGERQRFGDWTARWGPNGSILWITDGPRGLGLTAQGAPVVQLDGHSGLVTSTLPSPDGSRVVTTSRGGELRIWSTDGALLKEWDAAGPLQAAAWLPDSSGVIAGGESSLRLFQDEAGSAFCCHDAGVRAVDVSPDGRHVLSIDGDRVLRVFRLEDQRLLRVLHDTGPSPSARFSADGTAVWFTRGERVVREPLRIDLATLDAAARLRSIESAEGVRLDGLALNAVP